ncbi:DUF4834 family protein [Aquimarina brevivitae]|uniref:Uncharacterized protein DUF4834 n=1 Tax=Aquimarina brevivitae TaxID=323412 RepID=A0A4V2F5Q2_9FLAO|nr:DUF4834 family protein [Aquimarina brevivitae]RZS93609.1 uncharacterized protein DUF4834 [Aquimarina brevivitae]
MQEASFTGVLKVILIILLVYYGLKILTRIFAPVLLRYMSKKAGEKFRQHFEQYQQPKNQEEGEITLEKKPKRKSSNKDVGEYIDYEEID